MRACICLFLFWAALSHALAQADNEVIRLGQRPNGVVVAEGRPTQPAAWRLHCPWWCWMLRVPCTIACAAKGGWNVSAKQGKNGFDIASEQQVMSLNAEISSVGVETAVKQMYKLMETVCGFKACSSDVDCKKDCANASRKFEQASKHLCTTPGAASSCKFATSLHDLLRRKPFPEPKAQVPDQLPGMDTQKPVPGSELCKAGLPSKAVVEDCYKVLGEVATLHQEPAQTWDEFCGRPWCQKNPRCSGLCDQVLPDPQESIQAAA